MALNSICLKSEGSIQSTEAFTAVFDAADFVVGEVMDQKTIFPNLVAPLVKAGRGRGKPAYVLVDAMRFEMDRELVDGLGDDFEVKLLPCASPKSHLPFWSDKARMEFEGREEKV
jgi:hypothetical protein